MTLDWYLAKKINVILLDLKFAVVICFPYAIIILDSRNKFIIYDSIFKGMVKKM
jgi:hypothetical protein